jgi:flagellar basal body rod protein FlgG
MGNFDKDRSGNIIIRRDKKNNRVDKNGQLVNSKGYLTDPKGNIINKEGKIIFENKHLSKDDEIPKLFTFSKFNMDSIKGSFKTDKNGNPLLQKDSKGNYTDDNGRIVNEYGYLIDENGNIKNKRNYKVFDKLLLDKNG